MGLLDSRVSCMVAGIERLRLNLSQAVKTIVGCWSAWNL